jgi:hypothetical protein
VRLGDVADVVLAGVGWTHLPQAWVAADIAAGGLIELPSPKNISAPLQAMRAFYRISAPPGPAGRRLLDCLCNASLSKSANPSLGGARGDGERRPRFDDDSSDSVQVLCRR